MRSSDVLRLALPLLLASACSFRITGGVAPAEDAPPVDMADVDGTLDGVTIDAAIDGPPIDAPIDAPPVVIETLTILGIGTPVTSTFVPTLGVTYHLRASGFVTVASGVLSDADYWGFPGGMNDLTSDNTVDMGLAIDDATINTTSTAWGAYTATHNYEINYVGTGAPLTAQYHDNFFGNNSGSMSLEIWP